MIRHGLHGLLACLLLGCSGAGTSHAPGSPVQADAQSVRFGPAGRPAFEYRRGTDGLKPYLRSLVTASGIELLRDEPPGHEHHHGLMLAYGVDDVDFWGERYAEVPGRQVPDSEVWDWQGKAWPDGAGYLVEAVHWTDPRDGSTRLEEQRGVFLVPGAQDRPLQVIWISSLGVPAGRERVTLWGRHYFGLGLRFPETFDRIARFSSSDGDPGVVVRGDERLRSARWCACTAEVDGRTVTVALFDHPGNPRHPARFFTMAEPFAYLSATLDLAERPLELTRDQTLVLIWALFAWERPVSPDEIEQAYREWIPTIPTVPSTHGPPHPAPPRQGD